MDGIAEETKALLRRCSVATLSTQLFKRGLRHMVMEGVRPLAQGDAPMVGEAFTLRYIPAREDLDHVGVFADPEHPQRKAIETVPPGQVLVCDCRGDARAASGGSILMTRLKVRGAAGFVSDGGLRVIPRHLATEVARDAAEQERLEEFVIAEVRNGAPVIGTYPPKEAALARYQEWLKRNPKP